MHHIIQRCSTILTPVLFLLLLLSADCSSHPLLFLRSITIFLHYFVSFSGWKHPSNFLFYPFNLFNFFSEYKASSHIPSSFNLCSFFFQSFSVWLIIRGWIYQSYILIISMMSNPNQTLALTYWHSFN